MNEDYWKTYLKGLSQSTRTEYSQLDDAINELRSQNLNLSYGRATTKAYENFAKKSPDDVAAAFTIAGHKAHSMKRDDTAGITRVTKNRDIILV